jgi:long-chain acyl-CoA synthetase
MRSFYEQFERAAARHAGRTAIEVQRRDGVDAFTYRDLEAMAARTGRWLLAAGIGPGDRCAILAENDAHWCAAYLGVIRIGAVAVPLDTAYKARQVATLAADSGAKVIFTTPRFVETVLEARATLPTADWPIVLLHGSHGELSRFESFAADASGDGEPLAPCPSEPGDPAVILYTSGTTSDPKGVVLTHGNLLAEREGAFAVIAVSEHDCVLGVLPLFHALAQMANLLLPLSIGARVVFLESVNTTELLRALAERGVTVFACVPQFFYLIHQRVMQEATRAGRLKRLAFRALLSANAWSRVAGLNLGPVLFGRVHQVLGGRMRFLVTGGSRFDPAVGRDLYHLGFDILQAYGLTETSGAATVMRPGDHRIESVGQPLPNTEIRILPRDSGDDETQDGEVAIKGPIVMAGYFNRPDATAAALRDGWLHTGDLGRIDAAGRLTITGRKKELIVLSSGKNIYPEEIETHYRQSPVIKELCVLGLAREGEPSAERLYAVVVPDADVLKARRIVNAGDLVRFEMEGLSIGLPPHKRVLGYEVWMEPLPRTTTGKLKRFEIERRLRRADERRQAQTAPALGEDDRAWSESEAVAPILAVISKAARHGAVARPDSNLELDLGLDSMERVELLTDLEQRFGARVPEEEAHHIFTVRELVEAVGRHGAGETGDEAAGAWATILSSDPPADRRLGDILRPRPLMAPLLFVLLRSAMRVARIGLRIEVTGREHLPGTGPYLISPNHQSYLDSFLVVGVLPYRVFRQLFFVGASEYFQTPITRGLARLANVIPVDPDASLVPAMQAGAFGLRHGRVLVLFPEGERSIDGTVRTFKKGAAILSHHLEVPIVPAAIDGAFDVWARNRSINWRALRPWRRAHVALRFGQPMQPSPALAGAGGVSAPPAVYAAGTARLRAEVERLWRELRERRTVSIRRSVSG